MAGDNLYDRLGKINNYGQFNLDPPLRPENTVIDFLTNSAGINDLSATSADTNSVEAYDYNVASGFITLMSTCIVHIEDAGIIPSKFGGINALSNGLSFEAIDDDGTTVLKDLLNGNTIKENGEFSHLAGATQTDGGAGDDSFSLIWEFKRSFGGPVLFQSNQIFRATIQDNITGIEEMHIIIHGSTYPDVN